MGLDTDTSKNSKTKEFETLLNEDFKKRDFKFVDVDTLDDLQSMYGNLKSMSKLTKEQSDLIEFIDKRKYA